MDFLILIILFVVAAIIFTKILAHFKIGESQLGIITLIKSTKVTKLFDKFVNDGKLLNIFGDAGIVLGFGTLGLDYIYSKKLPLAKRIIVNLVSYVILSGLAFIIFSPFFSQPSPLYTNDYTLGIALVFGAFGMAGTSLFVLLFSGYEVLLKLLAGQKTCPSVAPIIPGVKIPNVPIFVPAHAWISLILILIIHEGMHGILARKAKVVLKSAGVLLLGFLPVGAFVEPDEESLERAPKREQLRIFAAGPTSNFATMILVVLVGMLLSAFIFSPFLAPRLQEIEHQSVEGIFIQRVDQNTMFCNQEYPATAFGKVEEGWKVLEMNGKEIAVLSDFVKAKDSNKYTEYRFEKEDGKIVDLNLEKNEMGLIGIIVEAKKKEGFSLPLEESLFYGALYMLIEFFAWFGILNFLVFFANFIPSEPFDGGKMAKIILPEYIPGKSSNQEKKSMISFALIVIVLAMVIIGMLPLII